MRNIIRKNYLINKTDLEIRDQDKKSQKPIIRR